MNLTFQYKKMLHTHTKSSHTLSHAPKETFNNTFTTIFSHNGAPACRITPHTLTSCSWCVYGVRVCVAGEIQMAPQQCLQITLTPKVSYTPYLCVSLHHTHTLYHTFV